MKITVLIENDRAADHPELVPVFGLSMLVEHAGSRILFDAGATGEAVRNAERLGVDLGQVDACVLSHHHFDHGGGLPAFLAVNARAKVFLRPPSVGKETFRALLVVSRFVGLDPALFERYRERLAYVESPTEILPGVQLLTDIVREYPLPRGDRYLYLKRPDGYVLDPFDHELVLAVREDDGIVVFTGCGHSGVLNMVRTVTRRFPGERIKAVVGGFHLIGVPGLEATGETRQATQALGEAMLGMPVDAWWTGHCTGHRAAAVLQTVLGAKLRELHTGTTLTL